MVTVFRTMDESKRDEVRRVQTILSAAGLQAQVWDDSQPGVVAGTYEVRVPENQAAEAEELIDADPSLSDETRSEYSPADPTHELDMVAVFSAESVTAELEATAVKSMLDANGITAMATGDSVLPMLRFEVMVPADQAEEAREIIAEAIRSGPAAAEEAERAGEEDALRG